MRRLALLFAGATIWLFLAAIPTLADGGVHVAVSNSGYSTLTADTCAGCHRAHTAQGQFLIKSATAEDLCLTCHGAASTGASVDVMTGIQYALASGTRNTGTTIGALRNGGFDQARIDSANPARYTYLRTATEASFRATVRVGAATDVTSSHLALTENGLTNKGVLWGNGAAGSGAGPAVEIECTSCHNPHGNGQYRILNTLPAATGSGFVDPVAIPVASWSTTTNRFTTSQAHGFVVGDLVTFKDVTTPTPAALPSFLTSNPYVIKSIPNGVTFTVAPTTLNAPTTADVVNAAVTISSNGTSSTLRVQRFEAIVDDAPLPAPGDERNYSILQVRGYQGTPASYLLYASDVLSARGTTSFNLVADIVGLTDTGDLFVTGLAHGFAVGDSVTIAGLGAPYDGVQTIATIPGATSFTLTGLTIGADATATTGVTGAKLGTATKSVAGIFTPTSGDYFHRTVPWNPKGINAACPYDTFVDSNVTANAPLVSACLTANDAPNGRPATITGKLKVNGVTDAVTPSAYGQIAFNDQISAWCSTCHSRYYSSTNPNPGSQPSSSSDLARTVAAVTSASDLIQVGTATVPPSTTLTSTGFSVGDVVQFAGTDITATGYSASAFAAATWYVVFTGSGSAPAPLTFKVASSYDAAPVDITGGTAVGTVTRLYPASASSWWFPRPGDNIFKYQHQTTTNRACVTCHVSHGTDSAMTGTYSDTFTYPDGSAATAGNSRLLKLDNRGTCQMCHDPTGTATAGQLLPLSLSSPPPNP